MLFDLRIVPTLVALTAPPPRPHRTTTAIAMREGADFELPLTKPLGIGFEEIVEGEAKGVVVKTIVDGGAAAESTYVWPGDMITECNGVDLTRSSFDDVMEVLVDAPEDVTLGLRRFGDTACIDFPNGARAFGTPGVETLQTLASQAGFEDVVYSCKGEGVCGSCEFMLRLGQSDDDSAKPVRFCKSTLPQVDATAGAMSIHSKKSEVAERYYEKMRKLAEEG